MPENDSFETEIREGMLREMGENEEVRSWGSALARMGVAVGQPESLERERNMQASLEQLSQMLQIHQAMRTSSVSPGLRIGGVTPESLTSTSATIPFNSSGTYTDNVIWNQTVPPPPPIEVRPLPGTRINIDPGQPYTLTATPSPVYYQVCGFRLEELEALSALMQEFKITEFHDIMTLLRKALGRKYYNQTASKVAKHDSLGLILEK